MSEASPFPDSHGVVPLAAPRVLLLSAQARWS